VKNAFKKTKDKGKVREEIVASAIASFRIEGITICQEAAMKILKKIEFNQGK